MNTLKLIILLGLPMIFFGGSASAQTAIGTANAGAVMGVSGFSGEEFERRSSDRGAIARVGIDYGSFWSDTRYQTGFAPRPGGTPTPGAGPSGPVPTPVPGTQSIGVFASGQTIVTNPGNTFTVAPPGTTSIVVGPSGGTSAVTPGTTVLSSPGTRGPGTFGSTTPTRSASAFGGLTPGTFGAATSGAFGGTAATVGTFGPNVGRR